MKLIFITLGSLLLTLALTMPAMAEDKEPVAKTLFTNVNVFDGEHEKLITKIYIEMLLDNGYHTV